jgi:hypothetical protein
VDAKQILRLVEELAGHFAASPGLPGGLGVALDALAVGAGLSADLIDHGHDPVVTITEFRQVVPSFAAGSTRLRAYMDELLQRAAVDTTRKVPT